MVKVNLTIFHGVHQSPQHLAIKTHFKEPGELPGNPHYFSCFPSFGNLFFLLHDDCHSSEFSILQLICSQVFIYSQTQKFHENINHIVLAAWANLCQAILYNSFSFF